jgi:hypothetical protein
MIIDTFQEVVEKLSLFLHIFRLIKVPPLLAAVDYEPFVVRSDILKPLECSAVVQTMVSPTGDD